MAAALDHHLQGRLHKAEQIYREVLAVEPENSRAWHLLGIIAHQASQHDVAVRYIQRAIELKLDDAEVYNNLGLVFQALERWEDSAKSYCLALERNPNLAEAHSNLGLCLYRQGKFSQAKACFLRALELQPNFPDALFNLGLNCRAEGKLGEAVDCYRRALELKPDFADAFNNLGNALAEQGKLEDAVESFRRAQSLAPTDPDARWNESLTTLLTGDLDRGWHEYEWRWKTGQLPLQKFEEPWWDGSSLDGKAILLHAEQGLGDTVQFVRYAPLVGKTAATVFVGCQPPLVKLLGGCPGVDRVIGHGESLPKFDFQAPLLSLPGIFKTTLETIPAEVPYLFAEPGLVEQWRERLKGIEGFRIGINWRGRGGQRLFRQRDIPLEHFVRLAEVAGVRLISLQKGEGREELLRVVGKAHPTILDLGEEVDTASGAFMDTAAIMMHLDLVITSDTAIPHLAGALGVPVWLALPFVPDWRWLLDRSDSPWYPTMQLFRQKQPGDWAGVFEEIRAALEELVAQPRN